MLTAAVILIVVVLLLAVYAFMADPIPHVDEVRDEYRPSYIKHLHSCHGCADEYTRTHGTLPQGETL